MLESNNVIKGQKVLSQQEKDKLEEDRDKQKEDEVKIFRVPAEVYKDFEELDEANEDMFEVVSYSLIIQFLEHICLKIKHDPEISERKTENIFDFKNIKFNIKASKQKDEIAQKKKIAQAKEKAKAKEAENNKENKVEDDLVPRWDTAIEFPDVIPSLGRSKLHEIANFFGLAHHSGGSKAKGGKKRRFLIYPKTLFIEKQEREKVRLEKERKDIIEKCGTGKGIVAGEPPKNP